MRYPGMVIMMFGGGTILDFRFEMEDLRFQMGNFKY